MDRPERKESVSVTFSEAEILQRRELLRVEADGLASLAACRDLIAGFVDEVVDEFYREQLAIPEIAEVIDEPALLERLRRAQRVYVLDLFAGRCDVAYVEHRVHIGEVHRYVGVEPKYYLAAMRLLRELLNVRLTVALAEEPARLARTLVALDRLLAFDTAVVMDVYIGSLLQEVDAARSHLADYAADLERKVARRTRQLEEMARRDPLTDLYNPRALRELLHRDLAHARRRGRPLSLIYFDIDDFKRINDTAGHRAGDDVLRAVGEILRRTCRDEDAPCRYGGDEFCVVAVDADLDQAEALGRRIIAGFAAAYPDQSLSMGIAQAGPDRYGPADELIDRADKLMYEAKTEPGFQIRR